MLQNTNVTTCVFMNKLVKHVEPGLCLFENIFANTKDVTVRGGS